LTNQLDCLAKHTLKTQSFRVPALLPFLQVLALREENELLMDQLVSAKVKLAEVEGEFLRSKRELLRSQEKYQQVVKPRQTPGINA